MGRLEIVIATRNAGKFRELKALLAIPGVRWHSLDGLHVPTIREDGRTFEDNAVKKARVIAKTTGKLVVADDSGLEVDALGGAPGVRSARFAGRHGHDHANTAKVLRLLRTLPSSQRTARFRCVLALANPTHVVAVREGILRGRITEIPKGRRGFGYDPIFLVPRFCRTTAELSLADKNRISHRARAARRLRAILQQMLRRQRAESKTRSIGKGSSELRS